MMNNPNNIYYYNQPINYNPSFQPSYQENAPPAQTPASSSTSPNHTRRGPWSPAEDKKLLELINIFGATNWVRISSSLATRTPKQCRERYHQNLKPSLNRAPITNEEGELIESLVLKYGKKWAEISRHLNGRSDNAIKNWWNGGANRRRRQSLQRNSTSEEVNNSESSTDQDDNKGDISSPGSKTAANPAPRIKSESNITIPPLNNYVPVNSNTNIPPINSLSIENHQIIPSLSNLSGSTPSLPIKREDSTTSLNSSFHPPKQYHLPQISFNTSMFKESPSSNISPGMNTPMKPFNNSTLHSDTPARSASFDMNGMSLPSINKRRLLDERRHSSAQPPYNTQMSASPNYSPLLLSNQVSRNNSVSNLEFNLNLSNSTSRRSSFAPDLFPNPLNSASNPNINNGHKRNISQNSSYNSPLLTPSTRFSVSSMTSNHNFSGLKNSSMTDISMEHESRRKSKDETEEKDEQLKKIAVSSLID